MDPRTTPEGYREEKMSSLRRGLNPIRPACSEVLCRLSYPGPFDLLLVYIVSNHLHSPILYTSLPSYS